MRRLHLVFSIIYVVLMTVIKPWDTSIPKQQLSHTLLMAEMDVSHGSMPVMILVSYFEFMFALQPPMIEYQEIIASLD